MRTVASIDIGTDKIVALIGEVDTYGDIHIIGVGEARSKCINRGTITKLGVAARAIATAVREAEEMSGHKVTGVVINVSGEDLRSQNEKDTINISPSPIEIEEEHINRLLERSVAKGKEDGFEIIHAIPRKYTLDNQEGIEDPTGLIGSKLTAQVHIVKAPTTLIGNLEKAVVVAGFTPTVRVVSALASAKAVLTEEEKENGVLLIDIGAGLTDYALFIEGHPVVTGSVPMGGLNITKDIAFFMKVEQEEAERTKKENGVAFVDLVREGEIIKIKPKGEMREVAVERRQLAEVIQVRLEEILEKVIGEIEKAGFKVDSANAGVVITGGTGNLQGIKDLVERFTDLPARIGIPTGVIGLKERIEDPKYATVVGLLKFAVSPEGMVSEAKAKVGLSTNSSGFKDIIEKIKEFLREIL